MSLASSPSLWLTASAAGLVLGVSSFFASALLEPAPATPQEEEEEAPPPAREPPVLLSPDDDAERGCQIVARATAAGAPRDDASFQLHRVGEHGSEAEWRAAPREDGAHRFVALPEGTYHLTGTLEGHGLEAARFSCGGEAERAFFELVFEPSEVVLSGRVTGRDDAPASGMELLLEQPHGHRDAFGGVAHVPLDGEGRFSVGLAAGRYSLLALAPHHTSRLQELTLVEGAGETRLRLPWRPEARGLVTDPAGRPLPNATVSLGPNFDPKVPPSTVTTDEEGRFSIPVLPGREAMLSARAGSLVGLTRLPAVSAMRGHEDVTLQLEEGRTVSGWVEQRDTRPCGFCDVTYRVKALGLTGSVKAKEDGSFELPGMPRRADVELWPKDGAIGAWGGQVATPQKSRVLLTYVPPAY